MNIYNELMQALSERTESNRQRAYDSLKGRQRSRLSWLLYIGCVLLGGFVGFMVSHGIYAIIYIGVLGSAGFFVSAVLFREYINMAKRLDIVSTLLLISEDERRHGIVDSMPVINKSK